MNNTGSEGAQKVGESPGTHVFLYEPLAPDADLESWYQLRRDLYLAERLIAPSELDAEGRYIDKYDPRSEHILMYNEADAGTPIGTCRIIDGRRGPLQVADQFGIEHSAHALEVSGFAILPEYRKTFATLGCYWLVYQRAVTRGYDEIHFEVEIPFRNTLVALGLPILQTGAKQFVYNAVNVPLKVTTSEVVSGLSEADRNRGNTTRFAELFERPFDGVLDTASLFGPADTHQETLA